MRSRRPTSGAIRRASLSRREFLRSAALSAAAAAVPSLAVGCAGRGHRKGRNPNAVYIYADDLGYGDVGCCGGDGRIRI